MTRAELRSDINEARKNGSVLLGDSCLSSFKGRYGFEYSLRAKDGDTIAVGYSAEDFSFLVDEEDDEEEEEIWL